MPVEELSKFATDQRLEFAADNDKREAYLRHLEQKTHAIVAKWKCIRKEFEHLLSVVEDAEARLRAQRST